MLQQLDRRTLGELTPLAQISVAPDCSRYFRDFHFYRDDDEWGSHSVATFQAEGVQPFAVVCYDHDPVGTAHLFVLGDVPFDEVAPVVATIAHALAMPSEAFQWRDASGEMVSLAPRNAA